MQFYLGELHQDPKDYKDLTDAVRIFGWEIISEWLCKFYDDHVNNSTADGRKPNYKITMTYSIEEL